MFPCAEYGRLIYKSYSARYMPLLFTSLQVCICYSVRDMFFCVSQVNVWYIDHW